MNENYRWSFLTHSVNKQRHNLHSVCAYFKTIDIASNRVVVEPHIGTYNLSLIRVRPLNVKKVI